MQVLHNRDPTHDDSDKQHVFIIEKNIWWETLCFSQGDNWNPQLEHLILWLYIYHSYIIFIRSMLQPTWIY